MSQEPFFGSGPFREPPKRDPLRPGEPQKRDAMRRAGASTEQAVLGIQRARSGAKRKPEGFSRGNTRLRRWAPRENSARVSAVPQHGAIALLAILILMAGALIVTTGLSLRGIGSLQAVDTFRRGAEVAPGADGCVAEALRRLRDASSYAGGTLSIGATTCTVMVTDDGGGQRTIQATSTRGALSRHVRAVVQVGTTVLSGRTVSTLTLTTWDETTD